MNRAILRFAPCFFLAATASPASAGPWTLRTVGAAGMDSVSSVAALPDGGFVIAGDFDGELALGPNGLVSAGASDAFIARVRASGEVDWARSLGSAGFDVATAVVVDRAGNSILVGDLSGTATAGDRRLRARGLSDAFAVSFRPDGTVRWAVTFGGPDWDATAGAAITSSGDIAVTGSTGTIELASDGARTADADAFVALVSAGGTLRWLRSFGGPEWDGGLAVGADRDGGVAVAGTFAGVLSLGKLSLESAGPSDGFLVRLTARGAPLRADRFGGAGNDAVTALSVAPDGTTALAGRFSGSIALGDERLVSAGGSDLFIARLAVDGRPVWATRAGGAGDDVARALLELPGGALLVAATYAPAVEQTGGQGPSDVVLHVAAETGALYDLAHLSGPFVSARSLAVSPDGTVSVAGSFAGRLRIGSSLVGGAGGRDGFLWTSWLDVLGD